MKSRRAIGQPARDARISPAAPAGGARGAARRTWIAACLLAAALATASAVASATAIDDKLAWSVRAEVPVDVGQLPARERQALRKLLEAGALLDRAYWQQAYRPGWEIRQRLAASPAPEDRKVWQLMMLNAGPFDRQRNQEPFYGTLPRPPGGGLYPDDLTPSELDAYLAAHPEDQAALLSPLTAVHRRADRLVAVPYHEEYAEWIAPAAARLREAAAATGDAALARYLNVLAQALTSDSFGACDRALADTRGSELVVIAAPQSNYLDQLKHVKLAYSIGIGIRDGGENRRIQAWGSDLDALERQLPLGAAYRRTGIHPRHTYEVVDEVFRGGQIAYGQLGSATVPAAMPAAAPAPFAARTMVWKNVLTSRADNLILPIGRAILAAGLEREISAQAYFDFNLVHLVVHDLGPREAGPPDRRVPLKELLGDTATALEETKAEIASLGLLDDFIGRGLLPAALRAEHYVTFIPHTFQTLYEGAMGEAPPPHDQAARLILNWSRERGGLTYESGDGRWRVDAAQLAGSLRALAAEVLEIQATGDRQRASRLLARYGSLDPALRATIDRVAAVRPLSYRPAFKVTGL